MQISHLGAAGRVALAIALTFALALPATADIRILASGGGVVGNYLDFFAKVKRSGERVVIDGPCLSACTLVLSSLPRSRICVTSRAVLGFHAPYLVDQNGHSHRSRDLTRAMAATYPKNIRGWINKNGGLSQRLILLKGRELASLYPRC